MAENPDRSLSLLNYHFGLRSFGETLSNTFNAIFLYKLGFPLFSIFMLWGTIYLIRFFFRPFYLRFCFGKDMKKILMAATTLYAFVFPLLGLAYRSHALVIVFVAYFAFTDTMYWLVYHSYFAALGDAGKRGKEIFYREALIGAGSILAPLLGGFLISAQGFRFIWVLSIVFMLFSLEPLIKAEPVRLVSSFSFREGIRHVNKLGFWLYLTAGFHDFAHIFTWSLVLFIMLGNVASFGLLLSIAVALKVLAYYVMGKSMDAGRPQHAFWLGGLIILGVIVGRAFYANTIPAVLTLDAILVIAMGLVYPLLDLANYNTSKTSGNPLWFQFFSETGYDIGAMLSLGGIGMYLYLGNPLRPAMLLASFGVIGLIFMLHEYQVHRYAGLTLKK